MCTTAFLIPFFKYLKESFILADKNIVYYLPSEFFSK